MTNDQAARSARRLATLIAVPVAVLAGFAVFQALKPQQPEPPQPTGSASTRPQATTPVQMPATALGERQETVCRALLSKLPDTVRDLARRPVTAGHEQNAAFGDPPITVACGGPVPSFPPTDLVYPLDAVCWHADQTGTRWTTVDREVPVVVTVPREYTQPGQWVIAFSAPIAGSILTSEVPSGCKRPSPS